MIGEKFQEIDAIRPHEFFDGMKGVMGIPGVTTGRQGDGRRLPSPPPVYDVRAEWSVGYAGPVWGPLVLFARVAFQGILLLVFLRLVLPTRAKLVFAGHAF